MSRPTRQLGFKLLLLVIGVLALTIGISIWKGDSPGDDPGRASQISTGRAIYDQHCAACHGAQLEGQANWRVRLPSGRMPAPPHDATGHTWHHPDSVLFGITKEGLVPGRYAPPAYESDMPAFKSILSDEEIWAVLAYIKTSWPEEIRAKQRNLRARR